MDRKEKDRKARAEAAQWIARLQTLPVERSTLDEFFLWRADDGHAQAYAEVERVWIMSESLGKGHVPKRETSGAHGRTGATWSRNIVHWSAALAGAALIILLAATFTYRYFLAATVLDTGIGEQRLVELADGSQVRLDADSRISVLFRKHSRHIDLERGQAFFTVTHDVRRPFSVSANGTSVVATGTSFNVRYLDDAVSVVLVEGHVHIDTANRRSAQLGPGQQWDAGRDKAPTIHTVDIATATAWTEGRLVLDRTPLRTAVAEVNRYALHPIRLDAPEYATRKISGSFDSGDISGFVQAMTALLPLQAERSSDGSIRLFAPPGHVAQKNASAI